MTPQRKALIDRYHDLSRERMYLDVDADLLLASVTGHINLGVNEVTNARTQYRVTRAKIVDLDIELDQIREQLLDLRTEESVRQQIDAVVSFQKVNQLQNRLSDAACNMQLQQVIEERVKALQDLEQKKLREISLARSRIAGYHAFVNDPTDLRPAHERPGVCPSDQDFHDAWNRGFNLARFESNIGLDVTDSDAKRLGAHDRNTVYARVRKIVSDLEQCQALISLTQEDLGNPEGDLLHYVRELRKERDELRAMNENQVAKSRVETDRGDRECFRADDLQERLDLVKSTTLSKGEIYEIVEFLKESAFPVPHRVRHDRCIQLIDKLNALEAAP
jgi:hypothetical protein